MKMKTYTLLFGVLLFVATVSGRHAYEEQPEAEQNAEERADVTENVRRLRKHNASLMRHRRRAWQNNMNPMYPTYGYDYPMPQNPYYPDYRNDQNNQDLLPQIYRLLDEISAYVKRPQLPPAPPQPIYIPYAVPYPVQAQCKCKKEEKESQPGIGNRFGDMEDENQNWGLVPEAGEDEENDGTRPISFMPIQPKQKPKRKQVNVEHGSSQAGAPPAQIPAIFGQQGRAPAQNAAKIPGACDVFSLSCCNGSTQQQKQCFINVNCSSTYDEGRGCNKDRILTIIDAYSKAYSPVN